MVSSSTLISKKQIELINATNKLSPEQLDNLLIFLNSLNAKSSRREFIKSPSSHTTVRTVRYTAVQST